MVVGLHIFEKGSVHKENVQVPFILENMSEICYNAFGKYFKKTGHKGA